MPTDVIEQPDVIEQAARKKAEQFHDALGLAAPHENSLKLLTAMLLEFYHKGAVDSADKALSIVNRTIERVSGA